MGLLGLSLVLNNKLKIDLITSISIILSLWVVLSLINISFVNISGLILSNFINAIGIVLLLNDIVVNKNKYLNLKMQDYIFLAVILIYLLLSIHLFILEPIINPYDDEVAYFSNLKQYLDAGSLLDPFSLRRLASYGGQIFLQSLYVANIPVVFSGLFEVVYSNIIVVFYFYLLLRKRYLFFAFCLPFIFLFSSQPRINSAPTTSAMLFLIPIFMNLTNLNTKPFLFRKKIYSLVLIIFTFVTLRANYLPFGIFLFSICLFQAFYKTEKKIIFFKTIIIFSSLMFLACLSLYVTSRTPFFPLFNGNFNINYGTFKNNYSQLFFSEYLWQIYEMTDFIFLFFICICLFFLKTSKVLSFIYILAFLVYLMTIYSLKSTLSGISVYRYMFGISISLYFFTIIYLLNKYKIFYSKSLKLILMLTIFVTLAIFLLPGVCLTSANYFRLLKSDTSVEITFKKVQNLKNLFERIENKIPKNSKVLLVVEQPYYFNYDRNIYQNIDVIGNVTVDNFELSQATDEQTLRYFKSLNFDYIIFKDPLYCHFQYKLEDWEKFIKIGVVKLVNNKYITNEEHISHGMPSQVMWAEKHLNFFLFLEKLKGKTVYMEQDIFVIKI